MKISLEHISKKFLRYRIFNDINFIFESPGSYAILGPNGSGKSTLLRIIAGMQAPSAGKIIYALNSNQIEINQIFQHLSFCAPGMDIVEELTLREFLDFHFRFKNILPQFTIETIMKQTGLEAAADKPIADFSSGMKQRVKLAQAIFADTPILILDEPCTNLDEAGVRQYHEWIERYTNNRLVIVASNDEREYAFCRERISLQSFA